MKVSKGQFSFILVGLILFLSNIAFTQVTGVKYHIKKDKTTGNYDFYIHVKKGSSKTLIDRCQFNSMISLVAPKDTKIEIVSAYNPLQNNQDYKGTDPTFWEVSSPLNGPEASPSNCFYAVRPKLDPSSFYKDLKPGDTIKLFTFSVSPMPQAKKTVRLFDNNKDPKSDGKGMEGRDFTNTFCIGSVESNYLGNE